MRTRRDMLAFTAGAAAARTVLPMAAHAAAVEPGTGTVPPDPDASVKAACLAFLMAERSLHALSYAHDDGTPGFAAEQAALAGYVGRQERALDVMEANPACTIEGVALVAACLAGHGWHGDFSFDGPGTITRRLLDCTMRSALPLAGLEGAAA